MNQEVGRQKWLDAEAELRRMQNQLNEVNKMNSKLELQYHHATVLLKNEIKVRKQVSDEKKSLVSSVCYQTCIFVQAFHFC